MCVFAADFNGLGVKVNALYLSFTRTEAGRLEVAKHAGFQGRRWMDTHKHVRLTLARRVDTVGVS